MEIAEQQYALHLCAVITLEPLLQDALSDLVPVLSLNPQALVG